MKNGHSSRRDFVKNCLAGAVVLAAREKSMLLHAEERSSAIDKIRVVMARDPMLRGNGANVDSRRVLQLLDRSMQALFDCDHPSEPWKKLVHPGERVGLKINALGGRGLSNSPELVQAVCERLQEAGIQPGDIIVWDRDTEEMERVGFRISTAPTRVQCFGTDRVGYEEELSTFGSVGSRLSKILTQRCDVMINVPVLKDHEGAGVTIALKNMYGVIHNPNKCHPNGCDPYVADVNMLPVIRAKMRLSICDATTACFEGGPGFKPQYAWKQNALLVSQDQVALDYTGWHIIERKRAEKGLKTLTADGRPPKYIATAANQQHRLGTNDPQRIAVLEV